MNLNFQTETVLPDAENFLSRDGRSQAEKFHQFFIRKNRSKAKIKKKKTEKESVDFGA